MTWVILIPVKNTGIGKSRLGEPGPGRARLATAIALDTVTAALASSNVSRVIVVTDDDGLARSLPAGVEISAENATAGIDAALAAAAAVIVDDVPRAALLGDLPALLPTELAAALAAGDRVRRGVVADANGTGTTLVTANAGVPWQSSFGEGSFSRHLDLGAEALDVPASSGLRTDVDTTEDLRALAGRVGRATADVTGEGAPNIRLVAVDLDGTLLDAHGAVPEGLWSVLSKLHDRGIHFVPASGRQHATLQRVFQDAPYPLDFIAENGAFVTREGEEVSSDSLAWDFVIELVTRVRALRDSGLRPAVVVCGKRSAYIDDPDEIFHAEAAKYYAALEILPDVLDADDQILKIAIFDPDGAEQNTAGSIQDVAETHQVVVAGKHWVDIMNQGVSKGTALAALQKTLGVTKDQTAAFGDYLNDVEMLAEAGWSYAMQNAHPDVIRAARFRAPSNVDGGVLTVLEALLRR